MRFGLAAFIFVVSYAVYAPAQTRPSLLVTTWKDVEDVLEQHVQVTHSFDDLNKVPEVVELCKVDDAISWEMLAQSKYPLVEMASFQSLHNRSADSAADAALFLVLSPDFPLPMVAVVIRDISNDRDSQLIFSRLTTHAIAQPDSPERWGILVSNLPPDRLKNWYESDDNKFINLTYKSIALDGIISDAPRKAELSDRDRRDLSAFQVVPGRPRAVYVLHANEKEQGFTEAVQSVLQDQTLPEIIRVLVAVKRRSFILQTLNWKQLGLSRQVMHALEETPGSQP